MLFESTVIVLRSMVSALERDSEPRWADLLESGHESSYELHQMSRPAPQVHKNNPAARTAFERASRAIPHVKLMNRAIRSQDREAAVECGRAAIAEMTTISAEPDSALKSHG